MAGGGNSRARAKDWRSGVRESPGRLAVAAVYEHEAKRSEPPGPSSDASSIGDAGQALTTGAHGVGRVCLSSRFVTATKAPQLVRRHPELDIVMGNSGRGFNATS